jgi:hypothetical protein
MYNIIDIKKIRHIVSINIKTLTKNFGMKLITLNKNKINKYEFKHVIIGIDLRQPAVSVVENVVSLFVI